MTKLAHRHTGELEPRRRGKGRDLPERLQHAEMLVMKYHEASRRHHTRGARATTPGKRADAERLAARADALRKRWAAEVVRLSPFVERLKAADRTVANISAAAEACRRKTPAVAQPRASERQARVDRETRRRFAEAGVAYDARTGAGAREFIIEPLGATARARVARYEALFGRPADATTERVDTVESFDLLCHSAHKGLYPLPKFESGSTGGLPRDAVPGNVLAREEMSRLLHHLGDDAFALMWVRIIMRIPFAELERRGLGDRRRLGAQFLDAVDCAARFYRRRSQSELAVRIARLFGGGMAVGTLCPA